jgi:mRNA-degrading endonuclease toxin of MazEF toxin-antitoxin module
VVTRLLWAWRDGDPAAQDVLVPLVYEELRHRAAAHLQRERADHTLQPTRSRRLTARHGLFTQVAVGIDEGLKHESALYCDALLRIPKPMLTDFIGALSSAKVRELDRALAAALGIDVENLFD